MRLGVPSHRASLGCLVARLPVARLPSWPAIAATSSLSKPTPLIISPENRNKHGRMPLHLDQADAPETRPLLERAKVQIQRAPNSNPHTFSIMRYATTRDILVVVLAVTNTVSKSPFYGECYTCFGCETKTVLVRILVIFQDRPMLSRII